MEGAGGDLELVLEDGEELGECISSMGWEVAFDVFDVSKEFLLSHSAICHHVSSSTYC